MKVFADLKEEWDFDKNLIPFSSISPDSQQKYWWKCQKCGYSSAATIRERLKGRRCRQCMLRENAARMAIPTPGESLGDLFPNLVDEWDKKKNSELSPFSVKPNSMKKVWWKCQQCGNEWQANIQSRSRGAGCPVCWESRRGKTLSLAPKEKSLAFLYPEISEEWNYEKNGELTPEHVFPKSNKKVWWKCKHNHEWESRIASRVNGSGCPICRTESHSSFPEQALFWYMSRDYDGRVENRHKEKIGNKIFEIDVFIPERNLAIEYDGEYWHRGKKELDEKKSMALRKHGIHVFRIREGRNNRQENDTIEYNAKTKPEQNLSWAILTLEVLLGIPARDVIDVQLHAPEILQQYKIETVKNSLGEKSPDVAKEWNYLRNGDILPTMFANSSNKKVWWVCSQCGYEWQATIVNRSAGHGCPKCAILSNAKLRATATPGLSFADKHPDLLEEWNFSRNQGKSPYLVNENSHEKVWWICSKCGYEWQASLAKRSFGRGCPVCNHRIVIPGKNDFLVEYPLLDKEWDYSKNIGKDPHYLSAKSHVKVYWKCQKCGNEWFATIATRTGGSGCPKCGKKQTAMKLSIPPAGQSLGDLFPELVVEWDNTKNDPLTAFKVYPKSTKKVWWKCQKCGHEWQAVIASRSKGTKCPLCSGHIVPGKSML